jgi:hypothetical protein
VYLIQDGVLSQVPVQINGLFEIINQAMQDADSAAFINGTSTNQPFINGIGLGGDTIGQTVNNLSRYSPLEVCTAGRFSKKYKKIYILNIIFFNYKL